MKENQLVNGSYYIILIAFLCRVTDEQIGNEQQINFMHSSSENIIERPIPFEALVQCLDDNKKSTFRLEYQKHGNISHVYQILQNLSLALKQAFTLNFST